MYIEMKQKTFCVVRSLQTFSEWEIVNEHNSQAARIPVEHNLNTKSWQKIHLPPKYAAVEFEGAGAENAEGIIVNRALDYIEMGSERFAVWHDSDNNTWRVYRQDRPSAPGIPVKYDPKNAWQVHMNVGLRGGGVWLVKQAETVIVDPGRVKTVTGSEILSTWWGMGDCSTVVVLSGWNSQIQHWELR
ncbi:MAG: hypothetical protein H7240_10265 [Glaciimonas sp.]|nr:hypothetical protein [Glaciimonas sp.]